MKVKFSVIPFIPAALAMIALRVMSIFGADENGKLFGMDKMAVAYTTIGISLALFLVCIVINIFDRKTAPVYPVKKNFPAGVLSIVSGALVIAGSVGTFMNTTTDSSNYVMALVCALFSLPAGIAFFLMSRVHFIGKTVVSAVSMLYVFPALWGCSQLVYEFLDATKVSISATDLSSLFCYIFITLYYFSHAMVTSRIKGRNPVKGCFIYGLPAVALLISNGLFTYFTGAQEGSGYVSALNAAKFLALAFYAFSFILEMFFHSVTKDELEIIDGLPTEGVIEKEEKKYIKTEEYEDMVFSERGDADSEEPAEQEAPVFDEVETISDFSAAEKPDEDVPAAEENQTNQTAAPEKQQTPSDYYQSAQNLDDFIIGYQAPKDYEPIPYFTKEEADKKQDSDSSFVTGYVDSRSANADKKSDNKTDQSDKSEKSEKSEKSDKSGNGFMKKLFKKKSESDDKAEVEPVDSPQQERVSRSHHEHAAEEIELVSSPAPARGARSKPAPSADGEIEFVNAPAPERSARPKPAQAAENEIEFVDSPKPERGDRPHRESAADSDWDLVAAPSPEPVRRRPVQQRPAHRPAPPKRPQSSRSDDIDALLRELDDKENRS